MGRVKGLWDWTLHTLLQRTRGRIAASADLLRAPPPPPELLPWEAEASALADDMKADLSKPASS